MQAPCTQGQRGRGTTHQHTAYVRATGRSGKSSGLAAWQCRACGACVSQSIIYWRNGRTGRPQAREKSGIWRVERKHAPRAPSRPKQPPLAHPSDLVGPLGAWGPATGSSGTWVGRMVHVHGRTGPRPQRAKRPILAPVSALPATGAGRWARHGPRGPMGSVGSGLAPLGPARHLPGPTIGLRGASDGPFRPPGFWLLHSPWPFGSVSPPAGVGPSRPVVA